MKKSISLHADVNDLKQAMKAVLKEANVATKEDLKNFATKDDLKHLATKDDLANVPTIKEIEKTLESYPTKEDLENSLVPVLVEIKKLRKDITGVSTSFSSTL